jgi:glutathione synthase/RimK-type ligase-like ATP-grasp enzyme
VNEDRTINATRAETETTTTTSSATSNTQMDINNGRSEAETIDAVFTTATTPNAHSMLLEESSAAAAVAAAENNMATIDSDVPITIMANDVIRNLDVGDDEHPGECYDNTDGAYCT